MTIPKLDVGREPKVVAISFSDEHFLLRLQDGRLLGIPILWYPAISQASPAQRETLELLLEGTFIRWPVLDLTLFVRSLLESAGPIEPWPDEAIAPSP